MRARRWVVLLDGEADRRRMRRFVLETRLRVRVVSGAQLPRNPRRRLIRALCEADVALVSSHSLARSVQEMLPGIRVVLIAPAAPQMATRCNVWLGAQPRMSDVLEAVRVRVLRKRGPKKTPSRELRMTAAPARRAA